MRSELEEKQLHFTLIQQKKQNKTQHHSHFLSFVPLSGSLSCSFSSASQRNVPR